MSEALEDRTRMAEQKISAVLRDLERDTGLTVDSVNVDTRNYANLATEIFLVRKARQ